MASKGQRWLLDSGILRKKDVDEEPQELLVFGYSCKLFRDDERAKMIDQGRHLIPWMGDNTLKIDRYDGRGALGDVREHEPPPGGFDTRSILTEDELKMEQLCDDERFRSLYNNDAEETMYHEEEMKRLHQALDSENTYGQVAYNYSETDGPKAGLEDSQSPKQSEGSQEEEDLPFVPPPELEVPEDMTMPETQKLNAIITKTALFISRQGGQMEILIKAKQSGNPQFSFLSMDSPLHPYYKHVSQAIKAGKYNPESQPEKEETEKEEESEEDDEPYLHPSLATSFTKVEAAPSIPSIQYKPSADCAYSMLVNKITGKPPPSRAPSQPDIPAQAMPPPGYYPPMPQGYPIPYPVTPQQYSHGPVIYSPNGEALPAQASQPFLDPNPPKDPPSLVPYGPTPPKLLSRPSFIVPPADVQIIIDKMASYVAKNGRDFEAIVRSKGDPRFNFLELSHQYHGYYAHKLTIYEGAVNPRVLTEEELLRKQEPQEEKQKKLEELHKKQQRMEEVQKRVKLIQAKKSSEQAGKQITTVSFSIKKPKDADGVVIEKRSALPLEESDDDEEHDDGNILEEDKPELSENSSDSRVNDDRELVDLTDDILEDCQKEARDRQAEERIKDKLAAAARDKMAASSRERQLQMERKRKAAMFLSQIAAPKEFKVVTLDGGRRSEEIEEVDSIPSPSAGVGGDEETTKNGSSLMNRLKGSDVGSKRTRPRSRSRSRSRGHSERHKQHKKHKKKKSSHKSYESPSSSRAHKSKKSKKSSLRLRSPARVSSHRHRHGSKHSRKGSGTSDSCASST